MQKNIKIVYDLLGFASDSRRLTESSAWKDELWQAFAKLGWTVTYHGPASSTNVEDEMITLESDGPMLEEQVLKDLLARFEIANVGYIGDGIEDA